MILRPDQCRAARGLLDWTQEHLAEVAGLSRSTVRDFEKERHSLARSSEEQIVRAFAHAGVVLIAGGEAGGTGAGVRRASDEEASAETRASARDCGIELAGRREPAADEDGRAARAQDG